MTSDAAEPPPQTTGPTEKPWARAAVATGAALVPAVSGTEMIASGPPGGARSAGPSSSCIPEPPPVPRPMAVNYGLSKVRFPSPVRVGAKIRARGTVASGTEVKGGIEVTVDLAVETDGSDKPACVTQAVYCFCARVGQLRPVTQPLVGPDELTGRRLG
ncbi:MULTISPECIES: hypothetical protein [unclassified Streptomyces]|uniref:hypothetical protein n=1 Tax=unclassified Streptomyces TaxID=2593676 RepID=UPI002E15F01C|nr:MaoC/PaaZ C-terminal domain-containing protein [Streptomyces sp. NBC_01197]WSS47399.1 MaoC/PaaZ C-terminal domain-containing protein [Streptomyces sp. NBC_01180]